MNSSRPTRARGLKLLKTQAIFSSSYRVAPHAGAWIETFFPASLTLRHGVAPHAGAWIETRPMTPK